MDIRRLIRVSWLACVLVSCLLLININVQQASAEETAVMSVADVKGLFDTDNTAVVPITLKNINGLAAGDFVLKDPGGKIAFVEGSVKWNPEFEKKFEEVGSTLNKAIHYNNSSHTLKLGFTSVKGIDITTPMEICTVTYNTTGMNLKDSANLTLESVKFSDVYGYEIPVQSYSGSIERIFRQGDATGDDQVNEVDATPILQYVVGGMDFVEDTARTNLQNAKTAGKLVGTLDLNADNDVTTADAMLVLRYTAELIDSFFTVTTSAIPEATKDQEYTMEAPLVILTADNGRAPFTWSMYDRDKLPRGLILDPSGVIYGKATRNGATNFNIEVTDRDEHSVIRNFTINVSDAPTVVSPVTAAPTPGEVALGTEVTLTTATGGAVIYYTTDGSEPTEASTVYTGPIAINADTVIKAKGFKAGLNAGAVAQFKYTVTGSNTNIGLISPFFVLSAGDSTVTPTRDSNTLSYTATVANNISFIKITPYAQAESSIKVNNAAVTSGTASGSINLNVGNNILKIVVTNGSTSKTYTITVNRLEDSSTVPVVTATLVEPVNVGSFTFGRVRITVENASGAKSFKVKYKVDGRDITTAPVLLSQPSENIQKNDTVTIILIMEDGREQIINNVPLKLANQ